MKIFFLYPLNPMLGLILIFSPNILKGQSAYKKRYRVKAEIWYITKSYNDSKKVKKNRSKPDSSKKSNHVEKNCIKLSSDSAIHEDIKKLALRKRGLASNVAFENEDSKKLYINPWLLQDSSGEYINRDQEYYYVLDNRRSVNIGFRQFSANVLVIPLKVRIGENKVEYSTEANLGAFLGYTWGKTNFMHRNKVGNRQYDSKLTIGGFLGVEKLEFTFNDEMNKEVEVKTAILSFGTGVFYAYQNLTFGLTGGLDYSLGENSTEWDFYGKPWLGISIGYSLFYL